LNSIFCTFILTPYDRTQDTHSKKQNISGTEENNDISSLGISSLLILKHKMHPSQYLPHNMSAKFQGIKNTSNYILHFHQYRLT
jgi:hypothetical protein